MVGIGWVEVNANEDAGQWWGKSQEQNLGSFYIKNNQGRVEGREASCQKPCGEVPWLRQTLMVCVQTPLLH